VLTDDDRRYLYELLERSLDARGAAILMAHLPPVGWADLATRQDLSATRAELMGEVGALRADLVATRAELKGEIAELRGEVHGLFPKLVAANIASMVGVAGLVLAAASLAH
jgi:hypothetical protein